MGNNRTQSRKKHTIEDILKRMEEVGFKVTNETEGTLRYAAAMIIANNK